MLPARQLYMVIQQPRDNVRWRGLTREINTLYIVAEDVQNSNSRTDHETGYPEENHSRITSWSDSQADKQYSP